MKLKDEHNIPKNKVILEESKILIELITDWYVAKQSFES